MTWTPDPSIIITAEQKAQTALDAAWVTLRSERDRRFEATRWLVERHAEELTLSLEPSLSEAEYADLLFYRQALRDLPENTSDPLNPEWPTYG